MLTVDSRECRTNPYAYDTLLKLLGNAVEVEMMEAGDYASTDPPLTIGIESKSFNDLVGSMASNRLDKQLAGLVDTYDVPVLLVNGMPGARGGKLPLFGAKRSVNLNWVM